MTITVLVDNNTYIDQYFRGEPALCCWLEDEDRRILFDTGYSDLLLQNAAAMGIDLGTTTQVVLSHGHNDHTGGLRPLLAAGWLQKDGKLQPVEQITVAGNFFTLLKEVEAVGSDLWLGIPQGAVVGSPSLRVKGLMVSGC